MDYQALICIEDMNFQFADQILTIHGYPKIKILFSNFIHRLTQSINKLIKLYSFQL